MMMLMESANFVSSLLFSSPRRQQETLHHPLLPPENHHHHWIVLSTICVDEDDEENDVQATYHDDDPEWKSAWNQIIQNQPVYCDFLMDIDDENQDVTMDHPRESSSSSSSILDSMQFFPNQQLHPCGQDNLLSSLKTTKAISMANCHYKIPTTGVFDRHSDLVVDLRDDANTHTNATASSIPSWWYFQLIPTTDYFSTTLWMQQQKQKNALLTTTIRVQFHTAQAKQIFREAWKRKHPQQSHDPEEVIIVDSTATHRNATATGATNNNNVTQPIPDNDVSQCTAENSLRQPQPLMYTTRQNMDELLLRNMETMLTREIQEMNAVLLILALLAMILTAGLGWTARQILYPFNNHNNGASAQKKGKEIPSSVSIGPEKQPPVTSPLSMDPVLVAKEHSSLNIQPEITSDTHRQKIVTPCTKLEEEWWNNRAIRRQNRHDFPNQQKKLQPPLVPISHNKNLTAPSNDKIVDGDSDEEELPRYILRTATTFPSTVTPPANTPCRTETPPTGPRTPPSNFLQELQGSKKLQPQQHSAVPWTATTTHSSPTPPSFVEDYWG